MKNIFLTSSRWKATLGIVFLFACIYLTGIPKTAVNVADSDDLSLASFTQSLAHPPGYNVLTALVGLGNFLPPKHFAFITHASSALLQSLNVGLFFLVALQLLDLVKIKRSPSVILALVSSVWWGLNSLTYQNAVIFEVFPFSTMCLLAFLYSFLNPKADNQIRLGLLAALAFFAHQLTLVVTGIALLSQIISHQTRQQNRKLLAAFLMGMGGLFSTYWFYFDKIAAFGWHIEPYFFGVLQFVSRATLQGGSAIETYASSFDLTHSLQSLVRLIELLSKQGSIVLIPMALYGWWMLKQVNKKIALSLGSPVLIYVLLFSFYLKFPTLEGSLSDTQFFWGTHLTERMMFGLSLLLHLLATLGLTKLYAKLSRFAAPRTLNAIVIITVVVASGFALRSNRAYQQFSTSDFSARYSNHLLSVLPEDAVVVVDTDIVFGLLYAQIIENVRPDVDVVPQVMGMRGKWFFAQAGKLYDFGVGDNETQAALVVHHALNNQKPIFVYHPSTKLLETMQAMSQPVHFTPVDFWLRVEKEISETNLPSQDFAQELLADQSNSLWLNGWRGHLATLYAMHAYYSGKNGEENLAKEAAVIGERLAQLPQTKAAVEASLSEGLRE